MERLIYLALLVLVSLSIVSCNQTDKFSYDYLLTHPRLIQKNHARCSKLSQTELQQDAVCVKAIKASKVLVDLATVAVSSPSLFGEKIVNAQVELVGATNPKEVAALKLKIATYYAVIRLRSGNLES